MKKYGTNAIGLVMISMGMLGLGFGVEYSGWVLFFGIIAAID